jgi:hypothetical protein
VVPSHATASSPHTSDHGSRPGDRAEHARRNSDSSGLSPTRRRAAVSAVAAGARHPAPDSSASSPRARLPSTDAYGCPLNRHSPSVKYTTSLAGSARSRTSHASPSATASSTSPGGTANDKTPGPSRDSTRPRGDSQPHGMAA